MDKFMEFLGVEVLEVRPGFARVKGVVKEEFTNIHGSCHGGYLTSLADFALGLASNADEVRRVAIRLGMEFFTPAYVGDVLIGEAEVMKAGRRICFYEMRIKKGKEVIAKGSAIVYAKA